MKLSTEKLPKDCELIAFRIGEQEFCVDVMAVREIRGWTAATTVPKSPSYIRGVINLRGTVLPIIDLGRRLGFANTDPTERHVIIVAQIDRRQVGLLVDAVSDILRVANASIQPTPDVACDVVQAFVRGLLPIGDRMISLIALDKILPADELETA